MDAGETADALALICSRVLGEIVASVILHGSLVLGDWAPGRSDIDLLVIVDRPLTLSEIEDLTHAVVSGEVAAAYPLDLRVVTRDVARTPTSAPPMELYIGLHPPAEPEIESKHSGEPDLLIEFSMCREHGRALVGAAPRELIGEAPDEWVLSYSDSILARWESLASDARNAELMVLTTCRIWRFSEERHYCSKPAAGAWALARDPSLQAVRDALRQRTVDPSQTIDPTDIAHLLRIVRGEIAARATSAQPAA